MNEDEIKLWAFYYNPMKEESASYIESYHRTEEGAIKAMEKHKQKEKIEYNKTRYGKLNPSRFGQFEMWYVGPFTLKIEE